MTHYGEDQFAVHICSFEAVPGIRKGMPYTEFREAVLSAGRFSAFEASDTKWKAALYDSLASDQSVVMGQEAISYPWTMVRAATPREIEERRVYAEKVANAPAICGRCFAQMRNADVAYHVCVKSRKGVAK